MVTPEFIESYKRLNEEQKEAVDTIDGPVMVIAGPGTGKTQILTLRIANILKETDTAPDSILALTFTESAVASMRERLVSIIGSTGYQVSIYTFHSFCNDVIRRYPDSFPKIIGAEHINDVEKLTLLKEIIADTEVEYLKPFGDNFFYLNSIRGKISELKRENVSPKELAQKIQLQKEAFYQNEDLYHTKGKYIGKMKGVYVTKEKKILRGEELQKVYAKYESELSERRLFDYEDMIVETVRALREDEGLLRELQEQFQYILADEHQDANNAQNAILELLSDFHESPNLFIVGDEKQAIFRFQGASLENFLYFKNRFKDSKVISLTKNYRSQQTVLDAAHSLIEQDGIERVRLMSETGSIPEKIFVREFSNENNELAFVVEDIDQKIKEGVPPEEIAVLYRNNADAHALIRFFEKGSVPHVVESDQSVLGDTHIQKLVKLLKAVAHLGDDTHLAEILYLDFIGLDALDAHKILVESRKTKKSLIEIMRSSKLLEDAGIQDPEIFKALEHKLTHWKHEGENENLLSVLEEIIHDSGYLAQMLIHKESQDKLGKLELFFEEVKSLVGHHGDYRIRDLLQYLDLLEEHNIVLKKRDSIPSKGAVRLMTAHRSKGREFEYVYVIGAYDGHWGNKKTVEYFDLPIYDGESTETDDDLRLFYVALTRAKTGVFVSYAKESTSGRLLLPSSFIADIAEDHVEVVSTDAFEGNVKIERFIEPAKKGKRRATDEAYLRELFVAQGLSVTALNNYLKNPWQYFFRNLLRVPQAPSKYLMYGNAVDAALKAYFDGLHDGKKLSTKDLLLYFEKFLTREPVTKEEFDELIKRGEAALTGYIDTYKDSFQKRNTKNKFKIETTLQLKEPLPHGGPSAIIIRGEIDKLEILEDKRTVRVVDYKTGKTKTRNELLGNTKNADGNYLRQLTFYKLMLGQLEDPRYDMEYGLIDFVEPDQSGVYHQEVFEISDDMVRDLKDTIEQSAHEIYSLSFWNRECDRTTCDFCDLVDDMKQ